MSALLDLLKAEPSGMPSTSARRKALAWARVSTDMQEERGLSLPEQLRQIQEYAEKLDIEIVEEFSEAASAYKTRAKRPEFDRMLARAREDSEISVILVHDLSRFSRDSINAQTLIRDLRRAGVEVLSVSDPVIDRESVAGVYMEAITFAKNEAYSREVAFHTRKGCKANVQTRDPETGWCYKNGGQPLWGYRSERLVRGGVKRGRPIVKSIWVPDDTIVAGRPVFEWTKECLRMAADGASLDKLRDFCNSHEIPAPRQQYWGVSTWHSILETHSLLKYAGYEVWNVRGKNQRRNPSSEWVIVENAHPALISEEEAHAVIGARRQRSKLRPQESGAMSRSNGSRFLLSGGLFKCERCGANMVGFTSTNGRGRKGFYYVCGSAQYRRGLGCGPGVFVDKQVIEEAVLQGALDRFGEWSDPERFARLVNQAIGKMAKDTRKVDAEAQRRLAEVDENIANLRQALESGLEDIEWANARLRQLKAERAELAARNVPSVPPPAVPVLDTETVRAYQGRLNGLRQYATNRELRELVRTFVADISLAPATDLPEKQSEPAAHEITINFRALPAQFVKGMGAGAGFEPATFGL